MNSNQGNAERKVLLASSTLNFSLPENFGFGWDYDTPWDRQPQNFAYDAVLRMNGVTGAEFFRTPGGSVSFRVDSLDAAKMIETELQRIVEAFPVRSERWIVVVGDDYSDATVSERLPHAQEYIVRGLPFRAYLVKHVPLACGHPAIDGVPADRVLADYGLKANSAAEAKA